MTKQVTSVSVLYDCNGHRARDPIRRITVVTNTGVSREAAEHFKPALELLERLLDDYNSRGGGNDDNGVQIISTFDY